MAISTADPGRVLLSTGSSDVLYLSERGPDSDFTPVSASGGDTPIVFDPASELIVHTAWGKSINGGQTWGPIMLPASAPPEFSRRTHMAEDPATHNVYEAGKSGLYRSTDQGEYVGRGSAVCGMHRTVGDALETNLADGFAA